MLGARPGAGAKAAAEDGGRRRGVVGEELNAEGRWLGRVGLLLDAWEDPSGLKPGWKSWCVTDHETCLTIGSFVYYEFTAMAG